MMITLNKASVLAKVNQSQRTRKLKLSILYTNDVRYGRVLYIHLDKPFYIDDCTFAHITSFMLPMQSQQKS